MRKNFFILSTWVVILSSHLGFAQDRPPLAEEMGWADRILINGKVVSMEDRSIVPDTPGRIYQAMAIKGKRIMALGSSAEIRALAGPKTDVIDLGGKTVVPGLIQTHYHLYNSAIRTYGPQFGLTDRMVKVTLVAEATTEATTKKITEAVVNAIRVQKIPKGQWISVDVQEGKENMPGTNRTWMFTGKINRRQGMDAVVTDHPVFVWAGIGGFFNAKAIEEVEKVFPDWKESTDFESGPGSAMNGYLAVPERGALNFEWFWTDQPLSSLAGALHRQGLDVIKNGMTTVATRLMYPRTIAAYSLLNREERMPHRLAYYVESQRGNLFGPKSVKEFYRGYGAPWTNHKNGAEMLWLNGMAHEVWDASQNNVCMGPDVAAPSDIKERERCPNPGHKSWQSIRAGIINGWRPAAVHGTSSHGARMYIRMLEESMKEANLSVEDIRNLRTTLEHNQLIGTVPDVMEGIKKFGIILNVNPGNLNSIPKLLDDYGEKLRPFIMPVKTWINMGIRVTFESSGTNFWRPVHMLVTRKTRATEHYPSMVLRPEEAVDRVTALKMGTTWASEYMLAEDTIGTLEPGKFADFAVLDRDFFTIPVDDIPNIKVVMTGLSGRILSDNTSGQERFASSLQ